MADRIQQTANVQIDIGWRQRVAKERAIAGRPPPAQDPFAHSLSSIISNDTSGIEYLQKPSGPPVPAHEDEYSGARHVKAHTVKQQRPASGSTASIGLSPGPKSVELSVAAASQLGGGSQASMRTPSAFSCRTPSAIRSTDPTELANNKLKEMELRVELER